MLQFFTSISNKALRLAIIIVIPPIINKKFLPIHIKRFKKCRIIIYGPAVTRVELCTNALIGVGATMARGSQALKGIWALLVDPANKIKIPIKIISNLNLFMLIIKSS